MDLMSAGKPELRQPGLPLLSPTNSFLHHGPLLLWLMMCNKPQSSIFKMIIISAIVPHGACVNMEVQPEVLYCFTLRAHDVMGNMTGSLCSAAGHARVQGHTALCKAVHLN
jgi:hypothetical protein